MLPLQGLLVVSLEQAVAAPACTLRLADAGARVIKVEREGGETARHYDRAVNGLSAYFVWLNRGKESAVLDIKEAADRALLEQMIAKADVFVQNLVPGATQRLGLGSVDLVARFPRLIAVDIVGYRQDSAARDMRAYDMLIQAESGVCSVTGTPDTPVKVGVSIADVMTGMIAMFDAMADMMSVPLLHHDYAGKPTPRSGLAHASIFPYGSVSCRDGQVVIVVQNAGEWRRLCADVLRRPDLVDDPRFADNPSRVENRVALGTIIDDIFGAMTRAEAIARLEAASLAWSNVSTVSELSSHRALRRMRVDTSAGAFQGVASPVRREVKGGPVPALGEHTARIRREFSEENP